MNIQKQFYQAIENNDIKYEINAICQLLNEDLLI